MFKLLEEKIPVDYENMWEDDILFSLMWNNKRTGFSYRIHGGVGNDWTEKVQKCRERLQNIITEMNESLKGD